jgi:hypothetical protein
MGGMNGVLVGDQLKSAFITRGLGAIRLGKNDRVKTLKCKPSKE